MQVCVRSNAAPLRTFWRSSHLRSILLRLVSFCNVIYGNNKLLKTPIGLILSITTFCQAKFNPQHLLSILAN
uniref:Uncharacterized protein n=1 Tax=Octopus bimaculoides TaxID=37653 RepID=A0A0L8G6B5_OCTBM